MRALGHSVWRDDEIPAHRAYSDVIQERIQAARAVVVLWSEAAARSEWVRSEAESARSGHKLVQATIDGARPPMPFDQIECADLVGWTGATDAPGWKKIVVSVAELTASHVDLSKVLDFRLGDVLVSPSTLRMGGASGDLKVESKAMEVLMTLARNTGRTVTRDQLAQACWGGATISNATVNRVIAQLRSLARNFDPPAFELETVAKLGFRLVQRQASTTPSPQTPQTPQTPPRAPPAAPGERRSIPRKPLIIAGSAFAVVAIAAALTWRLLPYGDARPPEQNSRVDVVAFASQGSEPGLQNAATDVSGTIVRGLSAGGVSVTARATPRDAAGSDAELRIGGSVGLDKLDYAFDAQILDRKSARVLWTDRFVRTAQQVQVSPGEVGYIISAVLNCALQDRDRAHSVLSTEAFGLYLNACAAVFAHDDSAGRMLAVTRRLVKVAPGFASGHAMHSIAAGREAEGMAHSPAEASALHAESKAAAELALNLDPDTPKAYAGLALNEGVLGNRPNQDRVLEERYIQKALKLDPDLPPARVEYASLLRSVGRINETVEFIRGTDPKDPRNGSDPSVAMLLAAAGDLEGAEAALKQIEAATRVSQNQMRWTIAFWWMAPKIASPKVRALAAADGSKEQVDCLTRYLTELEARKAAKARGLPEACATIDPNWRIRMLAREGDVDGAFAALGSGTAGPVILYYPEMQAVRRDPRFWPLAARMGLTDYWIRSGRWPDFCSEPGVPYDCKAEAAKLAARPVG